VCLCAFCLRKRVWMCMSGRGRGESALGLSSHAHPMIYDCTVAPPPPPPPPSDPPALFSDHPSPPHASGCSTPHPPAPSNFNWQSPQNGPPLLLGGLLPLLPPLQTPPPSPRCPVSPPLTSSCTRSTWLYSFSSVRGLPKVRTMALSS